MSDRYRKGAHTVYDIKYHFVWKTKYNYAVLKGDVALRTRQIIREICEGRALKIVSGNVRANHVHLLVSCTTDMAPSKNSTVLEGEELFPFAEGIQRITKEVLGTTSLGKRVFLRDGRGCERRDDQAIRGESG